MNRFRVAFLVMAFAGAVVVTAPAVHAQQVLRGPIVSADVGTLNVPSIRVGRVAIPAITFRGVYYYVSATDVATGRAVDTKKLFLADGEGRVPALNVGDTLMFKWDSNDEGMGFGLMAVAFVEHTPATPVQAPPIPQ